jgi:hypothetical protein
MRPMPWKQIAVQTRRARAHFERDIDLPDIRLARHAGTTGVRP